MLVIYDKSTKKIAEAEIFYSCDFAFILKL